MTSTCPRSKKKNIHVNLLVCLLTHTHSQPRFEKTKKSPVTVTMGGGVWGKEGSGLCGLNRNTTLRTEIGLSATGEALTRGAPEGEAARIANQNSLCLTCLETTGWMGGAQTEKSQGRTAVQVQGSTVPSEAVWGVQRTTAPGWVTPRHYATTQRSGERPGGSPCLGAGSPTGQTPTPAAAVQQPATSRWFHSLRRCPHSLYKFGATVARKSAPLASH